MAEPPRDPLPQPVVASAEADDLRHVPIAERDVDHRFDVADAPPPTGDEHDLPVGREPERCASLGAAARPGELRTGQAVHRQDDGRVTRDLSFSYTHMTLPTNSLVYI
jgi:hypothetical protein